MCFFITTMTLKHDSTFKIGYCLTHPEKELQDNLFFKILAVPFGNKGHKCEWEPIGETVRRSCIY